MVPVVGVRFPSFTLAAEDVGFQGCFISIPNAGSIPAPAPTLTENKMESESILKRKVFIEIKAITKNFVTLHKLYDQFVMNYPDADPGPLADALGHIGKGLMAGKNFVK